MTDERADGPLRPASKPTGAVHWIQAREAGNDPQGWVRGEIVERGEGSLVVQAGGARHVALVPAEAPPPLSAARAYVHPRWRLVAVPVPTADGGEPRVLLPWSVFTVEDGQVTAAHTADPPSMALVFPLSQPGSTPPA